MTKVIHRKGTGTFLWISGGCVPVPVFSFVGLGSIPTIVMLEDKAKTLIEHQFLSVALVLCISARYVILIQAENISQYLGRIGISAMMRIMHLKLAAIATQFIICGIDQIALSELF